MSRYCSKRNKSKAWRKTYGKPFIMRRALKIAQMAITASQAVAQISAINTSFGGAALKAVAAVNATINFNKTINSMEFNKGFAVKKRG